MQEAPPPAALAAAAPEAPAHHHHQHHQQAPKADVAPHAAAPATSPAAAVAHAQGTPDTPGAKSDLIGAFRASAAASSTCSSSANGSSGNGNSVAAAGAAGAPAASAASRPPLARSPLAPSSPAAAMTPQAGAAASAGHHHGGRPADGSSSAQAAEAAAAAAPLAAVPHHAHQHAAHPHQAVGSVSPSGVELLALAPSVPPGLARPEWCLREFRVLEKLYTGYASKVYRAQCRRSGRLVVLKSYHMPSICALYQHQIRREVRLHASLGHENVVALHAAFKEGDLVVLVLEHCDGGDLFGLLQRYGGRLTEKVAVQLVLEPFLRVLNYLHARGIVHRDIKPENILFSRQGATLKLADFGLAIDLREERAVTRAGTLDYMAPEILNCPYKNAPEENKDKPHLHYGPTVDSWAVGVLAYELLVGCPPFYDRSRDGVEARIRTQSPTFPSSLSDDARSFVRSALSKDPNVRPTILQLLNHPWVSAHRARRSMRSIIPPPASPAAASSPTAADAQAIVEVPSSAKAAAAAALAESKAKAAAGAAGAAAPSSSLAPAGSAASSTCGPQTPGAAPALAGAASVASSVASGNNNGAAGRAQNHHQFAGRTAPPCNSLPSLAISQSFSAAQQQQQQQQQQRAGAAALALIREALATAGSGSGGNGEEDGEEDDDSAARPFVHPSAHSSPALVADVRKLQLGPVATGAPGAGASSGSPSPSAVGCSSPPSSGDRSPRGWFARLLSPRARK